MTDDTPAHTLDADTPEEVVPDYSRVGFRELRKLCTARGLPADGTVTQLIDKLKAHDALHGLHVDTTVPEGSDEDVDLLGDDEPASDRTPPDNPVHEQAALHATPETSTGGGEAASAPPPDGPTAGDVSQYPAATNRGGRPNMAATAGIVAVGQGQNAQLGTVEVRAFRAEYVIGDRDITDQDHYSYLERTHAAAAKAGHATKGGVTIGERVGYGVRGGQRTAIYQVPLRRNQ